MVDEHQTTNDPLVRRLRATAGGGQGGPLKTEAANEIERLRAAIWRAMMEIENDGAAMAYETLQYAWSPPKSLHDQIIEGLCRE